MKRLFIILFTLLCAAWTVGALPLYALDGAQLLAQIDKNLSPDSYESYRKIINVEPDGKKERVCLFYGQKREG